MKNLKSIILVLLVSITFSFNINEHIKTKNICSITKVSVKKLKISFLPGLTDEEKAAGRNTIGCQYHAQLLRLVEQTDSYEIWTYYGDGTTRDIIVTDGGGDGVDPCANSANFFHFVNVSFDYIDGYNLTRL